MKEQKRDDIPAAGTTDPSTEKPEKGFSIFTTKVPKGAGDIVKIPAGEIFGGAEPKKENDADFWEG